MKKILAGAVSGAAALSVIFGAGPAVADNEYKGQTYAQVQERTRNRAVISSRTGSYLPTEECIVTGNRRASFLDSSGNASAKILVDLNCNDLSTPGGDGLDHPGNSAASPEGRRVVQLKERSAQLSRNYSQAVKAGKSPVCEGAAYPDCQRICQQSRACSTELETYLGL